MNNQPQQGQNNTNYNGYYNPYFALLQQMSGMPPVYNQPSPQNYGQQSQNQANTAPEGEIIWVDGVQDVEAKQLNPGSAAVYFDKNTEGRYYIRTRNDIGQYQTKVFESTEISEGTTQQVDMSQYVRRDELEALLNQLGGNNNGKQPVQSAKPAKTIINPPAVATASDDAQT